MGGVFRVGVRAWTGSGRVPAACVACSAGLCFVIFKTLNPKNPKP